MKSCLTFVAMLCAMPTLSMAAWVPLASADEVQGLVRFESNRPKGKRWGFEVRYLPTQNPRRGPERVDLQSVRLRSDLQSVTASGVLFVRDGDSNVAKTWELIPAVTLSDKGLTPTFEATAYLVNASFEGPWDQALRIDTRSQARLAVRVGSGRTSVLAKASAPSGPFNGDGFASSKAFELGATKPANCAHVLLLRKPGTRLVTGMACSR
jgi:hypothetical protein